MSKYQSLQKVMNVLENYIESIEFQKKIQILRKKYKIPEKEGLPFLKREDFLKRQLINKLAYCPTGFEKQRAKIAIDLDQITRNFPIRNIETDVGFKIYFYHNLCDKDLFESGFTSQNMCTLVNAKNIFIEYKESDFPYLYQEYQEDLIKTYPLALYIHPEATQRDIVDYIKQNWKLFELQKKEFGTEKTSLSKIKKRSKFIKERNDFIYENRSLSSKEILKKVYQKYGTEIEMDQGYISKIINMEKKRRKDV